MTAATERPAVLHLLTPARQASPFDVNMAADAGFQVVVPYAGVQLDDVAALTQDAIFSRGPKGTARTGIFVGGRDAIVAADMVERARAAMVPPFVVSLMADPSGAYTTAAAMVACVEHALRRRHGHGLEGRRVTVLGGTGPVGRIAGVIAATCGAEVVLSSHLGREVAARAARETGGRFGVALRGACGRDARAVRDSVAEAHVVLACAAAGVQVLSADDLAHAARLAVAADVNAVPPAGIAGVGVHDDAAPLAGTGAVAIGALAIGDVKYRTQQRLLVQLRRSGAQPVVLGVAEAFGKAREVLAGRAGHSGPLSETTE